MSDIPCGAIAFWTMADKLECGLRQLLADARKFCLSEISHHDIIAGNRETAAETGISCMTYVNNESATKILNS